MFEKLLRPASVLILLVSLLFLLGSLPSKAQIPGEGWARIAFFAGNTSAVALSPDYETDGTVFVGTVGTGLWRSQDFGQTWMKGGTVAGNVVSPMTITDIAVSPNYTNDHTIFVISRLGHIFKSTNANGVLELNLIKITQGLGTTLAISPNYANDHTIFAGAYGGGLYGSSNGGGSWSHDTWFSNIQALALPLDFPAHNFIVAGGLDSEGCCQVKHLDTGQWSAFCQGLGMGCDTEHVTALEIDENENMWAGTEEDGMYVRGASDSSWNPACDSAEGSVPRINAIAYSPGGSPRVLYEGRRDGLRGSTNNGVACVDIKPHAKVRDIAFSPQWDGVNHCDSYIATPVGLVKKTCPVPLGAGGPVKPDVTAIGVASGRNGQWLGSSAGLFKSRNSLAMVQYNNFPNGEIPEIVAVCLDPNYKEDGTCGTDNAILFVAANFPDSASDNGVYKSTNFGNTWEKMTGGDWPSSDLTMDDLAISPSYVEGGADTTLYAATTGGLYRWDGDTTGWTIVSPVAGNEVYAVAVPPTYDRGGTTAIPDHTVFAATDDVSSGTCRIYYSTTNGGQWEATGYPGATPLASGEHVTSIVFRAEFADGATDMLASSTDDANGHQVMYSDGANNWGTWSSRVSGLPSGPVYDLAASPSFMTSDDNLLCATNEGPYVTSDAYHWQNSHNTTPSLSVAFDPASSQYATAGTAAHGAYASNDSGGHFDEPYTGYGSLPNDVFETLAHTRNPCILFASSPSYGVFVSEDGGLSFRPWNEGLGAPDGPCVVSSGYGLGMMADRAGPADPGGDVIWLGTAANGIKYRMTYYDSWSGDISLDADMWHDDDNQTTGRVERFDTLGSGQDYPAHAASPDRGFFILPATSVSGWVEDNGGNPSSTATSVRAGYDTADARALTSGRTVSGNVAHTEWDYYVINVPTGSNDLQVFLDDLDDSGPMDPDLYLRYGARPDLGDYDFVSNGYSDESICVSISDLTLLYENFDGSWGLYGYNPPSGWTIEDHGDDPTPAWDKNDWFKYNRGDAHNYVAGVYYLPLENQDEWLISPAFDIPSDATHPKLEFDHYFHHYSAADETGYVLYRSDQHSSWVTLATYTELSADMEHVTIPLTTYIGDTNAQIAFRYVSYDGWEWQVDNVKVSATNVGDWYIGVYGYSPRTAAYELTATIDSGCTPSAPTKASAKSKKKETSMRSASILSTPKAPSGTTIWGTVNAQGVVKGTDSGGSTTWSMTAAQPANTNTQTILELSDLQVIVGCDGNVYYSPAPDEGATTWIDATPNVADAGSNDFTDLIQASNGDVLISADGTGSGTSAGGVWLSGDEGIHWMKISSGFDSSSQALSDIMVDSSDPPQYYSSTNGTGVYSRTITASAYPTVTGLSPNSDDVDGGATVTVTGTGFSNSCPTGTSSDCPNSSPVILFGDTEVATTWVSSTQLTCTAPAHAAGAVTVTVRNPDTRQATSGRSFTYDCKSMGSATNNSASDLDAYADTGVQVSWDQDVTEWGDGGDTSDRSYSVYRDGGILQANIAYATTTYTDTTGTNGVSYTYTVRYYNACGSYVDTTGASASDEYNVPLEVPNTSVTWDSGTQMSWSSADGATTYRVYRGNGDDVSKLPDSPADVPACKAYDGSATTTGDLLADNPSSGDFYWYLVAAHNGAGDGSLGSSRNVSDSSTACTSP